MGSSCIGATYKLGQRRSSHIGRGLWSAFDDEQHVWKRDRCIARTDGG